MQGIAMHIIINSTKRTVATMEQESSPPSPSCRDSKHLVNYSLSSDDIVCVQEAQVISQNLFYYHDVEANAPARMILSTPDPEEPHYYFDSQAIGAEDTTEIPFAEASLEPLLSAAYCVTDCEVSPKDGSSSSPCHGPLCVVSAEESVEAQPVVDEHLFRSSGILRPEFLFVSAIKPTPDTSIGLSFQKKDGIIFISRIQRDGLFGKSGFQVGDHVMALNNVNTLNIPLKTLRDVLTRSESLVSICVHNIHGDPHTVLSSIQKPLRDNKLGISFQMKRGALTVSKMKKNSLFAQSLLMPDHRCFFINGQPCDNMGADAARDLTAAADRVTIISRPRGNLAAVLSVGELERRHWSAMAMGAGVAAAALASFGSLP